MDNELLVGSTKPSQKEKRVLLIVVIAAVGIWVAATIILSLALKTTRNMVVVSTDQAPKKLGPYHVAKSYDNMIFLSGQVGVDPKTNELVQGGIANQTKQVLENLKAVLAASNSSFDNVVKCTAFLTNISEFKEFNDVYATYFKSGMEPARSTIEVTALPKAGALVEIEAVAAVNE